MNAVILEIDLLCVCLFARAEAYAAGPLWQHEKHLGSVFSRDDKLVTLPMQTLLQLHLSNW